MKMKMKRCMAFVSLCAFVLGTLPGHMPVSEAAGQEAVQTADYGISSPRISSDGTVTWDCIYFGNYWQNDTNGDGKADQADEKEPIKWRVLSVDRDDAFLLADQNLDCRPYNETFTDVTWETCTLRRWLNDDFLKEAFTADEQSVIKMTAVANHDNEEYETEGGADTQDKVYLLSYEEVANPAYGFSRLNKGKNASLTRKAGNTVYARQRGVYTSSAGNAPWWLRSPGSSRNCASIVNYNGHVNRDGRPVYYGNRAARPVLHLELNASSNAGTVTNWSHAGTVSAKVLEKVKELTGKGKVKAIRAGWQKVLDADGYEVWVSTSGKLEKKMTKRTKAGRITVKKLERKKTYYVKVRAYMLVDGKKAYGRWSGVVKVKTK